MRRSAGAFRRAIETLEARGHRVRSLPTSSPGDATELARRCVYNGAGLVLAAGGDGTINEVLNGMVGSTVPLAILPGGTANVLAMELGIGKSLSDAATLLPDVATLRDSSRVCVAERVSLGLLRPAEGPPRHFLLMAGIGLDAHIVYNLNPGLKARFGKLSYWLGGFSAVNRRLDEFDVEMNGQKVRASFALASRVRNYGGDLEIACNACLLEDSFELVLFEGEHASKYLKYFAGVLTRQLPSMKGVTLARTQTISLTAPNGSPVYIQVDGEYAGRLPATIEIVPDALTLVVPSTFSERMRKGMLGTASA
jgi:diacylglycerol kinase (ATP)